MKILFVSNDLTHHLVPFFRSLFPIYGDKNCTFAVLKSCENRHKMGFPEYDEEWLFEVYNRSDEEYKVLWTNADIIITRVWDRTELIEDALKANKLVFYASERWYRPPIGMKRLFFPKYLFKFLKFRQLSKYSNFYYLAMGYYAGLDFKKVGLCKNRIFSFGYFTPQLCQEPVTSTSGKIKLIWVGNMLTLKKVIDILIVYKDIYKSYNISLDLIGQGTERSNLEQYVKDNCLIGVTFRDFLPNEEVKKKMIDADIYIFPSNGYEGWGAVVNEAMQTKCAVIASCETGAARSMIINGKNGFTYSSGDCNALREALVKLLENPCLLNSFKEEGYKTITLTWSALEAARRFSVIQSRIFNGESLDYYKEGPMALITNK